MPEKEHRLGVSEKNLVVRRLKLQISRSEAIAGALAEIDDVYGVDEVSYDQESQVLRAAYDATRVDIDGIKGVLARHRIEISHGLWHRLKEEHYRSVDQTVKDNAYREPWSCHQQPGSGKGSK